MEDKKRLMFYADGVTDLRLGDRVEIRRFLRKPLKGVVCYVPGQCKPNRDMQGEGLEDWGVSLEDGSIIAWVFLPEKTVKPSIKLISRGDVGDRLLKPDVPLG